MHLEPDIVILVSPDDTRAFFPFCVLHPIWEIRVGAFRLFEKIRASFPSSKILYHDHPIRLHSFLARFAHDGQKLHEGNILVLDATIVPNEALWNELALTYRQVLEANTSDSQEAVTVAFHHNETTFAAYIPRECTSRDIAAHSIYEYANLKNERYKNVLSVEVPYVQRLHYLFDAISLTERSLVYDSKYFTHSVRGNLLESESRKRGIYMVNPDDIFLGERVQIAPNVVLDASSGPILIGNDVKIMPNSTIIGPCFIGDHSVIKIGAKIYEKTSIGEWCKVGGEVENSVIHAFSNKQHDGFLGHSYISEWVNLGADTNTSDLKNNYSTVRIRLESDREVSSGMMFLGLLCGDHTKSGINTMFNTGTVAGVCGNIFGGGYVEKYLPSFTWGNGVSKDYFTIEKAIELTRTVMARRNRTLTNEEEVLLRKEYEMAVKF